MIDVASGTELLDLGPREVFIKGGFNPGGVLEPGRYVIANIEAAVEIWDLTTQSKVASLQVDGDYTFSGAFDTTGSYLLGGTINGQAWALDLVQLAEGLSADEALIFNVHASDGSVVAHALGDGGLLATNTPGRPLRLWDFSSGELRQELRLGMEEAAFVVFSRDAEWLLHGQTDYEGFVIRRYPLDPNRLVELAKSMVTRGLTADECLRFPLAPSCEGE